MAHCALLDLAQYSRYQYIKEAICQTTVDITFILFTGYTSSHTYVFIFLHRIILRIYLYLISRDQYGRRYVFLYSYLHSISILQIGSRTGGFHVLY